MTEIVPNVILSIHPEYADGILDGTKPWEFRRQPPVCDLPFRVILYATTPVKAAVGAAWVPRILKGRPDFIAGALHKAVPHSREGLLSYFEGKEMAYALEVTSPERFDDPIPLDYLRSIGLEPGDNFRYGPDVRRKGSGKFISERNRAWRRSAYLRKEYWPLAIPEMGPRRQYGPTPWGHPNDPEGIDRYQWTHPDAASIGYDYLGDVCPMCGVPLSGNEEVVTRDGDRGELWEVSPSASPVPAYHPDCYVDRRKALGEKYDQTLGKYG